jgi:hypothetical protein
LSIDSLEKNPQRSAIIDTSGGPFISWRRSWEVINDSNTNTNFMHLIDSLNIDSVSGPAELKGNEAVVASHPCVHEKISDELSSQRARLSAIGVMR